MHLFSMALAAPGAGAAAPQSPFGSSLVMLLVFGAFIYFMLWRPQAKRQKQHRDMISNLKQKDEVMTNGGITGRITKIEDAFLNIQIAEQVTIKIQKNAVAGLLPKGTLKF